VKGDKKARKFQIGDTVEVVKDMDGTLESDFKVGHRGKVIDYNNELIWPYTVERKNNERQDFKPQELKLIRKGTK